MHLHEAVDEDARPDLPLVQAQPKSEFGVVKHVGPAWLAAAKFGREELEKGGLFGLPKQGGWGSRLYLIVLQTLSFYFWSKT